MDLALADELDDVTAKLRAATRELEAALREQRPDHAELGKRRIQLARIARRRLRFLQTRIFPVLGATHPVAVRKQDERLRALFSESTSHIGAWSSVRIAGDWAGYVAAARSMIARLDAYLGTERRDLHPLLATLARAA